MITWWLFGMTSEWQKQIGNRTNSKERLCSNKSQIIARTKKAKYSPQWLSKMTHPEARGLFGVLTRVRIPKESSQDSERKDQGKG